MFSTQLRQPIVASVDTGAKIALTLGRSVLLSLSPSFPSSPYLSSFLSLLLPFCLLPSSSSPFICLFHTRLTNSFDRWEFKHWNIFWNPALAHGTCTLCVTCSSSGSLPSSMLLTLGSRGIITSRCLSWVGCRNVKAPASLILETNHQVFLLRNIWRSFCLKGYQIT